jgi:hypothetical protein
VPTAKHSSTPEIKFGNSAHYFQNNEEFENAYATSNEPSKLYVIVDSRCSQHMVPGSKYLQNIRDCNHTKVTANSSTIAAKWIGDMQCQNETTLSLLTLKNVLMVPNLANMLISVSAITNSRISATFEKH